MKMTIDELNEMKKSTTSPEEKNNGQDAEETVLANEYNDDALEYASLSFAGKIKYRNNQFKQRSQGMTFAQKCKYAVEFYRYAALICLVALILICATVKFIYNASLPNLVKVAIINQVYNDDYIDDYVTDSIRSYLGVDNKNVVNVYKNLHVTDNEDPEATGVMMTDYQTIGHYIINDMLDVLVVDADALKTYTWSEDTTDIKLALEPELYNKIEEYAITLTDTSIYNKNEGNAYIGALDITDTEFVKGAGIEYSPVYLLVPSTRYKDNECTVNFIKMVYNITD